MPVVGKNKQLSYNFMPFRIVAKSAISFVISASSVCLTVRLAACISAALTGRISLKFGIGSFHEKSVEKIRMC